MIMTVIYQFAFILQMFAVCEILNYKVKNSVFGFFVFKKMIKLFFKVIIKCQLKLMIIQLSF